MKIKLGIDGLDSDNKIFGTTETDICINVEVLNNLGIGTIPYNKNNLMHLID